MNAESDLIVEQLDNVMRVTFNRPDRFNALTVSMLDRAAEAIETCGERDRTRAIVLTGMGRAFSSGADLSESGVPGGTDGIDAANRLVRAIREVPKPVLAAVNGAAAGVGCSFALAADLVVAAESAYFMLAFANVGLMPDGGATLLLPTQIGRTRAARMAMLAERVPAPLAEKWGMVSFVVPDGDFESETDRLADRLGRGPTEAFARTKQAFNAAALSGLEDALMAERTGQTALLATHDHAEGVAAFRAKRSPQFAGH